jgi:hypothetical protein
MKGSVSDPEESVRRAWRVEKGEEECGGEGRGGGGETANPTERRRCSMGRRGGRLLVRVMQEGGVGG